MSPERAPVSSINTTDLLPPPNPLPLESPRRSYEQLWLNMQADVADYLRKAEAQPIYRPNTTKRIDVERYLDLQKLLVLQTREYLPEDKQALEDAIILCNLHQVNNDIEKRYRKKEDIPYASHPMEMALRAIEMGQEMKLVIACLLHDLPEDLSYLDLQNSHDVLNFVRWKFADFDSSGDIVRIISAETKTTGEELSELQKPDVQNYLLTSGIGRLMVSQAKDVLKTNGDLPNNEDADLLEKDKQTICAVIYDMCRVFDASFIERDCKKVFDPRVLFVKILDSWDNLKTDAFWLANLESKAKGTVGTVAKLIRTRMFINLAETLGYRAVASEMTERLVKIHDINNIIRPGFGTKRNVDLRSWEIQKKQMELDVRKHYQRLYPNRIVDVRCYSRMPWGQEPNEDVPTHLTPYVYVHIGPEIDEEQKDTSNNNSHPGYFVGSVSMSLTGDLQNNTGRPTVDHLLERQVGNRRVVVGKVRRESVSARWSATTRARHLRPAKPENSPELQIMHDDLTLYACNFEKIPEKLKNKGGKWVEAFPFFVSPRIFRRQGMQKTGRAFVVILNNKVFLAKNTVEDGSVWQMCLDQGLNPEAARLISIADATEGKNWVKVVNNSNQLTNYVSEKGKDPGSSHYFFIVKEKRTQRKKTVQSI